MKGAPEALAEYSAKSQTDLTSLLRPHFGAPCTWNLESEKADHKNLQRRHSQARHLWVLGYKPLPETTAQPGVTAGR